VSWPGSVSDSTVLNDSDIHKNPQEYFSRDQMKYIIADSGYAYAAESWLCIPCRQPAASFPQKKLCHEQFSSARVEIEHLNGGRWSSLRGIRNHYWYQTLHDNPLLERRKWYCADQ